MVYYVVVSTYYKHGDYELRVFQHQADLRRFIIEYIEHELDEYESSLLPKMGIESIVEKAIHIGNRVVDNQDGWGIREVRILE